MTPPPPSEPTVGETMGSLSLVLFCFSPFYLVVLSHHLWSQTRPASASASCREPSLPWWWSWPSGELPRRLWGGWLGESSCPQTQAWGKRKTWCGRPLRSWGRWAASLCLIPLGLRDPFQASPGSPGPALERGCWTVAPALTVAVFCGSQRGVHVHTVRAEPAH